MCVNPKGGKKKPGVSPVNLLWNTHFKRAPKLNADTCVDTRGPKGPQKEGKPPKGYTLCGSPGKDPKLWPPKDSFCPGSSTAPF